jgi:hypothetical protein
MLIVVDTNDSNMAQFIGNDADETPAENALLTLMMRTTYDARE